MTLHSTGLDHQMLVLGRYVCIASPQHISSWTLNNLCRLLCVVVVTVSCCSCCSSVIVYIHNYRSTTTKLHNNNNSNNNKKFNLHKLFNLCSDYFCCYHVILLFLFLFIENDRWTTTTKTTQSILHKLLFLQEFTSPIHIPMYDLPLQQLNMKWTNIYKADLMKYCSWPPDTSTKVYICIFSIACPQNVKPTLCITVNVKLTWCSTAPDH